jgi:Hypothetical protein (DUF2513)
MKRNMDLVRQILIAMDDHDHGFAPDMNIEGFTEEEIGYHCYLMDDAGLIEAADATTLGSSTPFALPIKLTWSGHEFLENSKDQNVWDQTKQAIDKLGGASFSIWTSVMTKIVMQNLGIDN